MKYIFIVNPAAGNNDKKFIFERIKSTFRFIDDEMVIEKTEHPGDAMDIAKRYSAVLGKDCVIVSCGGDGTVHEVANGLAGTETPLMVLPLGTGNDFAKKVYNTKKLDAEKIIEQFGLFDRNLQYDVKPIDLIDYNGEKCINVMSYGLDTKVETIGSKLADKLPFLSHQAYTLAIVPAVLGSLKYQINVDLNCVDKDGKEYTLHGEPLDYTLLAICNASYYGGGFCPAPDSKLDDGILDFALCHPVTLAQALPLIPKYSAGEIENQEKIETGYIKSGRIWSTDGSPLLGNCDGENFDYSEINFKVEEKALNVCFIKEN